MADIDCGFGHSLTELVSRSSGPGSRSGHGFRGRKNSILNRDFGGCSDVRINGDNAAGGVFNPSIGAEAHCGVSLKDGDAFVPLLQVDRMSTGRRFQHGWIGEIFGRLRGGEAHGGTDVSDVLESALDVVPRRRRGRFKSNGASVTCGGVHALYDDTLCTGKTG